MNFTTPEIEKSVYDITRFVFANKGNTKAFRDWNSEEIEDCIRQSMLTNQMFFASDEVGNVIGVVTFDINSKDKILHVSHLLSVHPHVLPLFIMKAEGMFPGFTYSGSRRGKHKEYPFRFRNKVLKIPVNYARN